jgi:hypothetical protein
MDKRSFTGKDSPGAKTFGALGQSCADKTRRAKT